MSSMVFSAASGNKRRFQKISKMPSLWLSTKIKTAKPTSETIEASHSYQSPGRFLPESLRLPHIYFKGFTHYDVMCIHIYFRDSTHYD